MNESRSRRRGSSVMSLCAALALTLFGSSSTYTQSTPGYHLSPADAGRRIEAAQGIVTSANALASEAGVSMLKAGGNAVDAVVAAAFAIGVVEPQMSGLGAGGSATVWMQKDGQPAVLDFYPAQPVDAWRGHTQPAAQAARAAAAGAESPTGDTTSAGDLRIVGVPGEVAGLLALHKRYGTLPLARLLEPAIRIAENGFPVGQMLASFIVSSESKLKPFPRAMALYFPGGKPLGPGEVLKNPELAAALKRVAAHGRDGFYSGPTADDVVAVMNKGGHPVRLADVQSFEPQWKRPLCTDYRGQAVLSAPPPQTGMQVLHTLELLEPYDFKKLGLPTQSAAAFDVLVSAMRLGQTIPRANADPNWVAVPARGISSEQFASARKTLVGTGRAATTVEAADAKAFDGVAAPATCAAYDPYAAAAKVGEASPVAAALNPDPVGERADEPAGETTHISVVDKDGNAVALTQTNSTVFGSGGFASGFFLNDSGFRFSDQNIDAPARSRWRIRTTTIAPTIVVRDGRVQMVIGAPGGSRIPTEILQVMVYTLDYGMDPLDAVRMPRIFPAAANPRVQLGHGFTPQLLKDVRDMGYEPASESAGYARLYMIVRRGSTWIGVADPQHDGQPRGY